MLNTAWTRLLLPWFVTHEVIEVWFVYYSFMFIVCCGFLNSATADASDHSCVVQAETET